MKIDSETIKIGEVWKDNYPIIVLYNSIDVTDECAITPLYKEPDITKVGTYKLDYKITYNGSSKTVSRTLTVKDSLDNNQTTTTKTTNQTTTKSNIQ